MENLPTFDRARAAAVIATGLIDAPAEARFEPFIQLARKLTKAPLAFVTLVLPDRQYFPSATGFTEPVASRRETPLHQSLCRHVVDEARPLIIRDGRRDARFAHHGAITELGLQAYLGCPIIDEAGLVLGSVCVADREPHAWTDDDLETVRVLGEGVRAELLRRTAERARREMESSTFAERELLVQVLQTSVAAIMVLDPQGRILFCNASAERVLGMKRTTIEGLSFDAPEWHATALDGGPWSEEDQPFTRVLRTEQPVFDVQHAIEWPNGEIRFISVNGAPIHDAQGKLERLVFLVNDITEQHLARQSFRRAAEQFAQAFRLSPHFALLCERAHGRIVEVSDGFTRSLQLPRQSCLGQKLDALPIRFPGELLTQLFDPPIPNSPDQTFELSLQSANGRLRSITARVHEMEVGDERFMLLAGQDLTDQREQEQQRLSLETQLREAQKVEVVGRLAAGLAHDFNNILTAIIGNAELLSYTVARDPDALESVNLIKRAGQRAAEQIKQILNFSRRARSDLTTVPVGAVMREVVDLFRSRLPQTVELRLTEPPTDWCVTANSGQLHQILMNLLTNAAHAVAGKGRILLQASLPTDSTSTLQIEVEDNGGGINPVHLPLIFEPFFTTRREGTGTGIGLALARSIARSFAGDLTVVDAPDRGTVFRLTLPRPAAETNAAPSTPPFVGVPAAVTAPPTRHASVLLVDDDPEVLLTGRLMLEQMGHTVDATNDATAALESLRHQPDTYDLLITDNLMPVLTGVDLLKRLRQDEVRLPVVVTSGYGSIHEHLDELRQLNAVFVPKPFSLEQLARGIDQIMQPSPLR